MSNLDRSVFDQYFTLPLIAEELIESIILPQQSKVADFSVGTGELLAAVVSKFSPGMLFGCDIDSKVLTQAKRRLSSFRGWKGDFLNSKFRTRIRKQFDCFDLVVLNPPFSIATVAFENEILSTLTQPSQFLLHSISFLKSSGTLAAVMPASLVHSSRDRPFLRAIKENCRSVRILINPRVRFVGCHANVAILKIQLFESGSETFTKILKSYQRFQSGRFEEVKWIKRGLAKSPKRNENHAKNLIHTTNLAFASLRITPRPNIHAGAKWVIAFPRVGRLRRNQISIFKFSGRNSFSGCVLLIGFKTKKDAVCARRYIFSNWNRFAGLYGGTGAMYTSVALQKPFWEDFSKDLCVEFEDLH